MRHFAFLLVCLVAAPAAATPEFVDLGIYEDAFSSIRVNNTTTTGTGSLSDNTTVTQELQDTIVQISMEAETGGGLAPFAFASAQGSVIEFGRPRPFQGDASAWFSYEVGLFARGPLDEEFDVPIRFVGNVSATSTEFGDAFASIQVTRLDNDEIVLERSTESEDIPFNEFINFAPGEVYQIDLRAFASSLVGLTRNEGGSAFADPTLEFDQALFDQQRAAAGLPTFNLEDTFAIGISPFVIPEPRLTWLIAVAAIGLWGRRGRNMNSARAA